MPLTDLARMMGQKGIRTAEIGHPTWRSYFTARPMLYAIDPKGAGAKVRVLPAGFASP